MFKTDENATEELTFNIEQPGDDVASEPEVSEEAQSQPQAEAESQTTQELEINEPVVSSDGDENTEKQKAADAAYKQRALKRKALEAQKIAELNAQEEANKAKADSDRKQAEMYAYYQKQQLGPEPNINDKKYYDSESETGINVELYNKDLLEYHSKIPKSIDNQEYQVKSPEQVQREAQIHVIKDDVEEVKGVLPHYDKVMSSSDKFLGSLVPDTPASAFNDAIAEVIQGHDGMGLNYAKIKASLSVKGAQERFIKACQDGSLNSPYDKARFFQNLQNDFYEKPLKKRSSNDTTPPQKVNTNGGSAVEKSGIEKYGSFS